MVRLAGSRHAAHGLGALTPIQSQFFKYVTAPGDKGGIWQFTDQGGSLIDQMMLTFADTPTAFAVPSADGDVIITWYAGSLVPPPGSEPGPYSSVKQLIGQYDHAGMVHILETDVINPRVAKRAVILTQNPATVAKLASTSSSGLLSQYAVDATANPNVLAAARMIGPPGVAIAGIHFGLAGFALAGVAGLVWAFGGKGKRRN